MWTWYIKYRYEGEEHEYVYFRVWFSEFEAAQSLISHLGMRTLLHNKVPMYAVLLGYGTKEVPWKQSVH